MPTFIDLETTGLLLPEASSLKYQPKIIEICALRLDDNYDLVDSIETLVDPEQEISEEITKITGIRNEDVEGKPKYIDIHDSLVDLFLGERIVVAHNAPFDLGVIYCELARHNLEYHFPWPPIWHCTAEESIKIGGRRLRLTHLHELATGNPHTNRAHRAEADVHALIRCYRWLIREGYFSD